jgi:hypothetical protein
MNHRLASLGFHTFTIVLLNFVDNEVNYHRPKIVNPYHENQPTIPS